MLVRNASLFWNKLNYNWLKGITLGQQQLLLIVLGAIIVGIAVVLGITVFQSAALENKRDVIISENVNLANMALQYYKKSKVFGGGQSSFNKWKIPNELKNTTNGYYSATVDSAEVKILGTSNEEILGDDYVQVETTVTPNSIETKIIKWS